MKNSSVLAMIAAAYCVSYWNNSSFVPEIKHQTKTSMQQGSKSLLESDVVAGGTSERISESYRPQYMSFLEHVAEGSYTDAISDIQTPYEAGLFCTTQLTHGGNNIDKTLYGESDYWASGKVVFGNKVDDCDGGAVLAASLLYDDGYPPYILTITMSTTVRTGLFSTKRVISSHAVFLYKDAKRGFGTIGINDSDIISDKESIHHILYELGERFEVNIEEYKIHNLAEHFPDFTDNNCNNDLVR